VGAYQNGFMDILAELDHEMSRCLCKFYTTLDFN